MVNDPEKQIGRIFGDVVRKYRARMDISQEELAGRAGVDRTFISRIERGMRQPTITTILKLGLAFEISSTELVRDTEIACKRAKIIK